MSDLVPQQAGRWASGRDSTWPAYGTDQGVPGERAEPGPAHTGAILRRIAAAIETGAVATTMAPDEHVLLDVVVDGVRCVLQIRPHAGRREALSPREVQIARMVADGRTNRAIATALDISLWTVSTHLRRIFAKTGVGSRAEMVAHLFGGPGRGTLT